MGWGGKIVGAVGGLFTGGIFGMLVGAFIGHLFDARKSVKNFSFTRTDQAQSVFFTVTFAVMGHIAKADGQVSSKEIRIAESVMQGFQLSPELKETAKKLFQEGKQDDFDLSAALQQFRRVSRFRSTLLQVFMEIQIQTALADGKIHPVERALLLDISAQLGIPEVVFRQIERLVKFKMGISDGQQGLFSETKIEAAHATLELRPDADMNTIKKAYRRLMNKNHPDKLVAKGLPEEMISVANQKTQAIREAYEVLKKHKEATKFRHVH